MALRHCAPIRPAPHPRRTWSPDPVDIRPPRQVCTTHAVGKPEVVLNPRARSCLPSRRFVLDNQRPQSFGRSVDRRSQPCQTRSHDHQVIELFRRLGAQPDLVGQLRLVRLHQVGTIAKQDSTASALPSGSSQT